MKKEIRYVGKHMPQGIYEVERGVAEVLLNNPNWSGCNAVKPVQPIKKEEVYGQVVDEMYLRDLMDSMGWRKFQKYAMERWNTTDNSKEDLIKEILAIENGI